MFAGGGTSAGGSGASGAGAIATGAPGSYSSATAEANDLDALVFEFGTAKCKLGFAGEDFPRVYDIAQEWTDPARAERDADAVAQWLFDATSSQLQTRLSDHPLLWVERSFPLPEDAVEQDATSASGAGAPVAAAAGGGTTGSSSKKRDAKARERMVEVFMEQMGLPALFAAKSAVLTCYANARTSGLVVELGATYSSVTGVHDGYAGKSQVAVFGGRDLDAFLSVKLQSQLPPDALTAVTSGRRPVWSYAVEAKESGHIRVADAAFDEAQNAQLPHITYELPDKTVLSLGTERFSTAEQYFVSSSAPASTGATGEEPAVAPGIALPEMICEAGSLTSEAELRKEMFQNIVLTGGSSCFENLPARLEREVAASPSLLHSGSYRVKVIAAHAQERKIGAFLGGSILASLGSFHEMWMSKAEYAEHGAALIHKKCP